MIFTLSGKSSLIILSHLGYVKNFPIHKYKFKLPLKTNETSALQEFSNSPIQQFNNFSLHLPR